MEMLFKGFIALSQMLLFYAKGHQDTKDIMVQTDTLLVVQPIVLKNELTYDAQKLAFWLNIYNAQIQIKLHNNPGQYNNRSQFFNKRDIVIAGKKLSFDDIEHGILRHSKAKLSLGYFNKWFPNKFERNFRTDTLDYRIHFALNCGAESCPPIAFYDPLIIDKQLNLATKNYLRQEVVYDSIANSVTVPKLMQWFKADFGGKKGIWLMLQKQGLIPLLSHPKIKYKPYNWNVMLNHYSE